MSGQSMRAFQPERRKFLGALALAAAGAGFSARAAESSQIFRVIVPLAPGSMSDTFARALAPVLGAELGQTVVVENVTGAPVPASQGSGGSSRRIRPWSRSRGAHALQSSAPAAT